MFQNLPKSITLWAEGSGSHLQGIAIDRAREYLYCSFTTCLIKADLRGNILASVSGLAGHLGCIAYHEEDGRIYGSLEYKHDSIGKGILKNIGCEELPQEGFYIARFDVEKLCRLDMDAERDGIMQAVFLKEVFEDYAAPGHRFGCSGIDGITFGPRPGETGEGNYLYVAYGVYGDVTREDNDHQVILRYDISQWDRYARPLNQKEMHRCGPEQPEGKYFVYTGNTTYGIQNLEYDPESRCMIAAVYPGVKAQFPNYPMFFIDCTKAPERKTLKGIGTQGQVLALTDFGSGIWGSQFPLGSTGIAGLGEGMFYISEPLKQNGIYGGVIKLYGFCRDRLTFEEIE